MKKSCPDPTKPTEIVEYYLFQLKKLVKVWYRDSLRDPFGKNRKKRYKELINFFGSHAGKPCFVFANGPSIQKLDPMKISKYCSDNNADIFCVNRFVNSEFAKITKADFWVLSDPGYFEMNREDIRLTFENASRLVRKGLFLPSNYVSRLDGAINIPLIGFNDLETSHIFSNSINPIYPRSYLSLSAYKALAIAVFGGYAPIYICGFDNTYIQTLGCDINNRIYRIDKHFDSQAHPIDDTVFYLNYKYRTVSDELLAYSRLFGDLRKFQSHTILNLDIDSLTDAFKKDGNLDVYL